MAELSPPPEGIVLTHLIVWTMSSALGASTHEAQNQAEAERRTEKLIRALEWSSAALGNLPNYTSAGKSATRAVRRPPRGHSVPHRGHGAGALANAGGGGNGRASGLTRPDRHVIGLPARAEAEVPPFAEIIVEAASAHGGEQQARRRRFASAPMAGLAVWLLSSKQSKPVPMSSELSGARLLAGPVQGRKPHAHRNALRAWRGTAMSVRSTALPVESTTARRSSRRRTACAFRAREKSVCRGVGSGVCDQRAKARTARAGR